MMDGVDLEELEVRRRLKADFPFYARNCLTIRPKVGALQRFLLNETQTTIHERIEEQRRRTGKVRAIILKARQPGCSTYVEGRFYWRVTHEEGFYAFILTHEDPATQNLFDMANRFHEHCPAEVRPETGAANAKELNFPGLDSGYRVATAGSRAPGRSGTMQLFHGSEVAHWPNDKEHAMGAMQAVPDMPGTEIILESTANGLGNYFHQMWQAAERGESDFIAIFIPWFASSEYRKAVPQEFRLTPEETEYQGLYKLDLEQMAWRRSKLSELNNELWRFRQEYPATPVEAFQTSGIDSFIAPEHVMRARKEMVGQSGQLVIGVDVARFGNDRTSIIRRRTRVAYKLESHSKLDNMAVAAICAKIIQTEHPKKMFIDVGGGQGVIDRLRELGFGDVVESVNFGEKPVMPPPPEGAGPLNRRAEMWMEMRNWLKDAPVQIPDSDTLHADLCGPTYSYDSNQRLRLERKEDMAKRGLRSPDEGDALALTFAAPVVTSTWERPLDYSRLQLTYADTPQALEAALRKRDANLFNSREYR